MKDSVDAVLEKLDCNERPDPTVVEQFLTSLDFVVDKELLDFVIQNDGAEGFVSDEIFLQIWPLKDIISLNPYYEDVEICHRLLFFGSDGSNLGFAVDKVTGGFVSLDFLEIGDTDPLQIASSFGEFLKVLSAS